MTYLSKFFQEHIEHLTCQEILHAETCTKHLRKDIVLYALSNLKYFAPICLMPVLIKIKHINKTELRKTLEYYLECAAVGTCMGCSINFLMCVLRNISGKFTYYSFTFIPSVVSSYILYLGRPRVIDLYETTIFQCAIETFFLMRKNILSRAIATSKTLQTCIFMTCSAIILHCKQLYNTKGFWLLSPNMKKNLTDNIEQCSKCDLHPQNTCNQYLVNGLRKYFLLGLSLDLIKMLIGQVTTTTPNQSKFVGKLKHLRLRSMSLLTAYIGIYRFTHCWLNRTRNYSDYWNHILSAFLAGSCYYLYPQSTLFSFALVQAMRSSWKMFEKKYIARKNKTLKLLLTIPYTKIFFSFALANCVHLIALQPKYVSNLATTVANGLTNKHSTEVQNQVNLLKAKFNFERSH